MNKPYNRYVEIENPQDKGCNICNEIARICNLSLCEATSTLPDEWGEGYLKKIAIFDATEIAIHDFSFKKTIIMKEIAIDESFKLNFCLGEAFQWGLGDRDSGYIMEKDESCIFPAGKIQCTGRYEGGLRYKGVTISLHPQRYQSVIDYLHTNNAILDLRGGLAGLKTFKTSPLVMELVKQIIDCPFSGIPASLYIEGKILELTATYLNEMICQKEQREPSIKLSREDMSSLSRIKDLLNETFVEPMTISALAKLSYLNEYKLKAGFKEVYGQSIYKYVIDRRMETAKQLMVEKRLKVKEAASMVGYTNISHFIEAFRKRYGVTPGVYVKNDFCFK